MAKEANVKLTKFELEIMESLWALGSASVREIQEQLPERKRPAYTTVQTIIYRLEEKGALRRVKKIGNAHIFEPVVTRKAAHRRVVDELLDFFGGTPRSLMAQFVETGRLTLDDLREMEVTLARLESEKLDAATEAGADAGAADAAGREGATRVGGSRERRRK
ncbi:MAG: BlaI/MecI/CopY family transcriptional regulator [Acidobacteria bacterium]|nr:BlaI/MecI/CopY family transcriptional regulator [Acidobacteriota bacterium]